MLAIRFSLFLTLAALAALLAGCAGSGGSPAQGGGRTVDRNVADTFTARIDHAGFAEMGYRLRWTGAAAMGPRSQVAHAVVEGGAVLVQDTGNVVTLIQTEDGRARWSAAVGAPTARFTGLARAEDSVLASSDVELFVLSDETGDLLDRQNLDLVVNTPPVVTDGAALFGSTTGRVLAHDLRTGLGRWQYQLQGAIEAAPTPVGENVGFVSESGDVIVLNPSTGTALARGSVFGAPGGAPAGGEDVIAFTSLDQSAYAFNADGGARLWRYRTDTPLAAPLEIIEGVAYFAVPGRGMVGLNVSTGDEVWSTDVATGVAVGLSGRNLIVREGERLFAIDPRGAFVAEVSVPGLREVVMPDPSGGDLYVVTRHGAVSRFVTR
jgi:outer membrane protein assembly factor BamB